MGLRYCSVKDCGNCSSIIGIRFFKFPNNLSEEWLSVVGRGRNWRPSKNSFICSQHFPSDLYGRCLFPDACPVRVKNTGELFLHHISVLADIFVSFIRFLVRLNPSFHYSKCMGTFPTSHILLCLVGEFSSLPPPTPIFIIVHVVGQLSLYFYFLPQDGSAGQST